MAHGAGECPPSDIADEGLAEAGRARIGWAQRGMPVLRLLTDRFAGEQPFAGLTVAACLHVTAETAGLVGALRAGGARVFLAASNPLSTQDDVAAALAAAGTCVFARAGADEVSYAQHIHRALDSRPDLVIDDGGDLVDTLSGRRPELLPTVRGGCESTSTGVLRLRRMAAAGALPFPMVATDTTATKRMFDNTAGTGQSVLDAVLRATNILLAGRTVVVAGFGPCGRGIAARASGLGAQVIVTEVDPVRALDAVLSGYRVLPMREAAAAGEVIITVTGSRDVIAAGHLPVLRDGAILANAGHFDAEIDLPALAGAAVKVTRDVRPHADEYTLADGRRVVLLAEGRVVNLVAAEGNPPQVMDVSFAGQALALRWLARDHAALPAGVHDVPPAIDEELARLTLESSGARIDALTDAQRDYLNTWRATP
jgi:adenosylhomocysteinase